MIAIHKSYVFSLPYGSTFTNQPAICYVDTGPVSTRLDSILDSAISHDSVRNVISLPDCPSITNEMSNDFVDATVRLSY